MVLKNEKDLYYICKLMLLLKKIKMVFGFVTILNKKVTYICTYNFNQNQYFV